MIGAVSAAGCDDRVAGDDANDGYEVVIDGDLELIGISGRRLQDGESYRVPLDSVQVVHLGDTAREAMVLVNRSRHDILIGSLSLNAPNEWRLLAPTRARVALGVTGVLLHPDARIDFDVAVTPFERGARQTWLELAWQSAAKGSRTRRIALVAEAVGTPSATGPGQPR